MAKLGAQTVSTRTQHHFRISEAGKEPWRCALLGEGRHGRYCEQCLRRLQQRRMADLEREVEPLLTSSIRDGAPLTLTADQQGAVARWALKTVMVCEFTGENPPFYTVDERHALRTSTKPASNLTRIWLAHYTGSHMSHSYGVSLTFMLAMADGSVIPVNAHCATVSVGRFAFQTVTIRPSQRIRGVLGFPMRDAWDARTTQLWPTGDSFRWPPALGVDDARFNDLINRFKTGPKLTAR